MTNDSDKEPVFGERLKPALAIWNGASSRLRTLSRRSVANAAATWRIALNRKERRPSAYPLLSWRPAVWNCLMAIAGAVLLLDAPVASFRGYWSPSLLAAAEHTTDIGLSGWYLISSVVVLLVVNLTKWRRRPRRRLLALYNWTCLAFFVLTSVGLSGLAVNVLKYGIGRVRPQYFPDAGVLSFDPFAMDSYYASFPSGHATTVGSVAAMLILFFPAARYVVIPLAIWIAATRAIVGAHYPSDVVAGLVFGFSATVLTAIVFARLGYIFRQKPAGLPDVKRTFRVFW